MLNVSQKSCKYQYWSFLVWPDRESNRFPTVLVADAFQLHRCKILPLYFIRDTFAQLNIGREIKGALHPRFIFGLGELNHTKLFLG